MDLTHAYDNLCDLSRLRQAWLRVEDSDGCAGVDGVTVEHFALNLDAELAALSRELTAGSYEPLPLIMFKVPKSAGGERVLRVPAVRDRVVQNALIAEILPAFEAEFEDCSFAYRKGRSVDQALDEIESLHQQGYEWLVDGDIRDYFDSVDHSLLFEMADKLVPDPRARLLIRKWVSARVYDGEKIVPLEKGLPQGAPISPLLANLYLDRFDERILEDHKLVRFADDFLVLCKTEPKAAAAFRLTASLLADLKLNLAEEKSRVTNFQDGFKYLGATFIRGLCLRSKSGRKNKDTHSAIVLPPRLKILRGNAAGDRRFNTSLSDGLVNAFGNLSTQDVPSFMKQSERPKSPRVEAVSGQPSIGGAVPTGEEARREETGNGEINDSGAPSEIPPSLFTLHTLYIHEHGAVIRCEDQHLHVLKKDVELISLPAFKLDHIVLFGNTQITTPTLKFCLKHGITIALLSGNGAFLGAVEAPGNENVLLHREQFRRSADADFVLDTAGAIVAGKIANCRTLLQRRQRSNPDHRIESAIQGIASVGRLLDAAKDLDQIRGVEGAATRHYFSGFAACVREPFRFEKRTRRPPLDPVNALLSFGYSLLFYNIYAITRARGLLPYVGSLHDLQQGHPALCSDLIEEFRAPVVDSLVTGLLNKRVFSLADFSLSGGADSGMESPAGCYLTDAARRRFVIHFEERMNTVFRHPKAGLRTTWRGCIDIQVSLYIRAVRGEHDRYAPFEMQ